MSRLEYLHSKEEQGALYALGATKRDYKNKCSIAMEELRKVKEVKSSKFGELCNFSTNSSCSKKVEVPYNLFHMWRKRPLPHKVSKEGESKEETNKEMEKWMLMSKGSSKDKGEVIF